MCLLVFDSELYGLFGNVLQSLWLAYKLCDAEVDLLL